MSEALKRYRVKLSLNIEKTIFGTSKVNLDQGFIKHQYQHRSRVRRRDTGGDSYTGKRGGGGQDLQDRSNDFTGAIFFSTAKG